MNYRMNAGYIITDSVHVGNTEFVLGVSNTVSSQFVTWVCKDGRNYDWGHYFSDMLAATKDLLDRANQELEFCMNHTQPVEKSKDLEEPCL